ALENSGKIPSETLTLTAKISPPNHQIQEFFFPPTFPDLRQNPQPPLSLSFPEIQHGRNCPIDCASVYSNGLRRSGIYSILPSVRGIPIEVLCEMDTEGGGWTVIQRRQDGSVDFNRTWNEYKEGFGDLNGEFWLGNDNIHRMTSQGDYSLRIDLEDWNNKHKHAFYQVFR
uniref:Fibrinogen C-terminal domain-containing protein n=1 Tax=Serinus canaria TaxID=9135 RepID=A0A8C9MIK1_SERCA